jgi:peptide/nickel transport system ATP-binding protein
VTVAPLLEVANLRVEIPVEHAVLRPVRGLDLTVEKGRTLAIVGESGCGKSLTSLAILGLLPRAARLTADRIALGGQSLVGLSERDWRDIRGRRIAMIFQDPMTALDPCYRIGDQMVEVLRQHRRISAGDAGSRALALLRKVGIPSPEHRLSQFPHQLSGGLRQRVMIAMALLCEPELVIADEPTTALDVTIQVQILRLLADLQRETGIGLILVTHDIGVVASIADTIAVMYGGEIVETGPRDAIIGRPLHPYTEGLMQSIPRPTTRRDTPLGFIPGTVPQQSGALTGCGFVARCPYAGPACSGDPVALRPGIGDRLVRCVLPTDGSGRQPDIWTRPNVRIPTVEAS